MKISRLQLAGMALVVAAALAIIFLQTSGHGMIRTVSDPTPGQIAVYGDKLTKVVRVDIPLSFRVLKWVAILGAVCTVVPWILKRAETNTEPEH